MEVEIQDGATVLDLLAHLEISKSQGGVVSMEGRMLRTDDELRNGASVQVFQAVHGCDTCLPLRITNAQITAM